MTGPGGERGFREKDEVQTVLRDLTAEKSSEASVRLRVKASLHRVTKQHVGRK